MGLTKRLCMVFGHLTTCVSIVFRPISVYRLPRRALTLCPQLCMGSHPGARFPAQSADGLTLCPQLCMDISPGQYTDIGLL